MAAQNAAASLEIVDDRKNTNLHALAANGDYKAIREFNVGQKIDSQNTWGMTPLMFAAREGHLEAVKALLDLRADATKVNQYNGSVLLMAIASGNIALIDLLLKHLLSGGVSRQAMESFLSPIAIAILFNNEHVFESLVANKFNVRAKSMHTQITPLMFAALSENPKFSNYLIGHGADLNSRNINGETAQDMENHKNGIYLWPEPEPPAQIPLPVPPQPPTTPVVLVSPQEQTYYKRMSLNRKSSNIETPEVITPALSPVGYYPQVFFPSDFTPTQFASPSQFASPTHFASPAPFSSTTPFASPTYYLGCAPYAYAPYRQDYVVSPVYGIPSPFTSVHPMNVATVNGFH